MKIKATILLCLTFHVSYSMDMFNRYALIPPLTLEQRKQEKLEAFKSLEKDKKQLGT